MNDWFIWNGVDCRDYGIHALSQPSPIRPAERIESVTIPGRSGALTIKQGENVFDSYQLGVNCIMDNPYSQDKRGYSTFQQIIEAAAWLRGTGKVTFANRTGGYFKGIISNQLSFDRVLRDNPHRQFQVQWTVDPFFYLNTGDYEQELSFNSGGTAKVINEGNVPSKPFIRVLKDEDSTDTTGTIMCGNSTMQITFPDGVTELKLDCDAKVCYSGTPGSTSDPLVLQGTAVSGDWMEVAAGDLDGEFFTRQGYIGDIFMTPYWRCI